MNVLSIGSELPASVGVGLVKPIEPQYLSMRTGVVRKVGTMIITLILAGLSTGSAAPAGVTGLASMFAGNL